MRTLKELYEIVLYEIELTRTARFICNTMQYLTNARTITKEEFEVMYEDFRANKPDRDSEWAQSAAWIGRWSWWYLNPSGRDQRILFLRYLIQKHS